MFNFKAQCLTNCNKQVLQQQMDDSTNSFNYQEQGAGHSEVYKNDKNKML